jgi:hypothetical protein
MLVSFRVSESEVSASESQVSHLLTSPGGAVMVWSTCAAPAKREPIRPIYEGTMMRPTTLLAAASLIAAPASASTPAAWQRLQQQAERACISASAFGRPRVSNMIVFDDATGVVALLVTGMYRQPHMKGASGTNLCLYNRLTKKAAVEEAKGWGERR